MYLDSYVIILIKFIVSEPLIMAGIFNPHMLILNNLILLIEVNAMTTLSEFKATSEQ